MYFSKTRGVGSRAPQDPLATALDQFRWLFLINRFGTLFTLLKCRSVTVLTVIFFLLDRFGAKYRSTSTGIIYNDEMADFDIPGYNIVDGISPSPFNFPEPKKRPFSSMCPTIFTDNDGNVRLVIGASGGKRITTAVSLVCPIVLFETPSLSRFDSLVIKH